MSEFIFFEIPFWAASLSIFITLLVAVEIGYRGGFWVRERRHIRYRDRDASNTDVTVGAMLALLGLLLAFTYATELNRHDMRKKAILNDANAIGTAFLMADFAAEPARSELRSTLLEYAKTRTITDEIVLGLKDVKRITARSLQVQSEIWPITKDLIAHSDLPGPLEVSIIAAVTRIFDAHAQRVAVTYDRLPPIVFGLLFLLAVLSLGMAAYNSGLEGHIRRWRKVTYAFVLTALMIVLVD